VINLHAKFEVSSFNHFRDIFLGSQVIKVGQVSTSRPPST